MSEVKTRGEYLKLALNHADSVKMQGNERARYLMGFEHGLDEVFNKLLATELELKDSKWREQCNDANFITRAQAQKITELQTALSVSEARLKKCVEQRDSEIIARWVGVWRARKVIDECNKQLEDLK